MGSDKSNFTAVGSDVDSLTHRFAKLSQVKVSRQ